jgi:hypothetical protein
VLYFLAILNPLFFSVTGCKLWPAGRIRPVRVLSGPGKNCENVPIIIFQIYTNVLLLKCLSAAANSTVCRTHDVVRNGVRCAKRTFPLIKKCFRNTPLTTFRSGKTLAHPRSMFILDRSTVEVLRCIEPRISIYVCRKMLFLIQRGLSVIILYTM